MRIVPRSRSTAPLTLLLLLAVVLGLSGSVSAQVSRPGRSSVIAPERNDAGSWDGTYWYVNRDYRAAMWMRTTDGLPEIRLKLVAFGSPEEFETGWDCEASYEVPDGHGEFALSINERDANTIKGSWTWNLQVGASVRKQIGEVTIYRAGQGREVVMLFDPFKFHIGPADQERWIDVDQVWTFRKSSKRMIRWEELPF